MPDAFSNLSSIGLQDTAFLTATAAAEDGVTTPQGVVMFSTGTTSLGAVPLVGSAGVSTATLSVEGYQLPSSTTNVTATYNGNSTSAPVTSIVTLNVRVAGSSGNSKPVISGLTDAAAFQQKYSPGMIMSVFSNGPTLAPSGTAEDASSLPLPITIAGVSATVNGVDAPLYYVSPTQINLQVPWQTTAGASATLVVNNNGQLASQTFNVAAASPGFSPQPTRPSCRPAARPGARPQRSISPEPGGDAGDRNRRGALIDDDATQRSPGARQHHGQRRRRTGVNLVHWNPVQSGWSNADQLHDPKRSPDRHAVRRRQR